MAKFLLACYPVSGHLLPNIAVGHALRALGHDVAIYTGEIGRNAVEAEGFSYIPYQKEMDERLTPILLPDQGRSDAAGVSTGRNPLLRIKELKATLREWFLGTVPLQVEDLTAAIDRWEPDVFVTDIGLLGPLLVLHETKQVPMAVFCVLPCCQLPGPDAPTWGRGLRPPRNWFLRLRSNVEQIAQNWMLSDFRKEVDQLRSQYGLAPINVSVREYFGRLPLYLVAGAPELDYNRRDLPPTVEYVGACPWYGSTDQPSPQWLAELPKDRPVVHVTEGTIHRGEPTVLRAAAEGLGDLPMEVVMTTGNHRDPTTLGFGALAGNIRVESFVPHGDLLPRTDVVVTTGGAGTVLAALSAGVPLVVVPTGWDLPENAQRVVEAGVGVRLELKHCTPKKLRGAVETVLNDPAYRHKAQLMGDALARRGGPPRAAQLLEKLVTKSSN